jgi:NADPH:quinone reductase-like Zn-dependent oxidoreductase
VLRQRTRLGHDRTAVGVPCAAIERDWTPDGPSGLQDEVMRAAYIEQIGPPEAITYGDLPEPVGGPTDVVVEMMATTVNPVDTMVRSGAYETFTPFPFIVGRDAVGTVSSVGSGVDRFVVGDLVWTNSLGHDGRQGAAAQRLVVPVDRLYHLPLGVDPLAAVALVHPAATAHLALFVHGRVRAGDVVAVVGAAGNVGAAMVVLARQAGAQVVAIASEADAAYCEEIGAELVLDYAADVGTQLRRTYPDGIDVYLDPSGRNEIEAALSMLARRGRIVLLAGGAARPVLPVDTVYMYDRSIIGFVISHATSCELADAARAFNQHVAAGQLQPRGIEHVRLADLAVAHRLVESGPMRGVRLVATP